jgi:hypothetical protein
MIFSHALVTFFYEDNHGNTSPFERTSRVTFAAVSNDDGTYDYAAAWTAPMDNFARKTGRTIASARLKQGSPSHVRTVEASGDHGTVFTAIFADAMGAGPCRWTITDIDFATSGDEVAATV